MASYNRCSMCSFSTADDGHLLQHVYTIHRHDPNFNVYCTACKRSFKKLSSYRKHVSRGCTMQPATSQSSLIDHERNDIDDPLHSPRSEPPDPDTAASTLRPLSQQAARNKQWYEARYLLSLKEQYSLTQTAIDHIVTSTTSLLSGILDDIFSATCVSDGRDPNEALQEVQVRIRQAKSLFSGLSTVHQQRKYFSAHFKLVEPIPLTLGSHLVWKTRRRRKTSVKVYDRLYYVPLEKSLKALLEKTEVQREVLSGSAYSVDTSTIADVMDGEYVMEQGYSSDDLLFTFYHDELEVANPLGSRRGKQKLVVFYWTLLNVPAPYRSSLRYIQLLGVCNANTAKRYGMNKVLEEPVKALKSLANTGISVMTSGGERTFRGYLVAYLGDTPASNVAAGFKEGVGGARKCCRSCMVSKEELSLKLQSSQLRGRRLQQHLRHCALVKSDPSFSVDYGVNYLSELHNAPDFDVCVCFPHDIMHVIMEGVLPLHIKALLQYCILVEKFFTLTQLNRIISQFNYGYSEKVNKPRELDRDHLTSDDKKIVQSASQMWLFGRLLPLMIGQYVPRDDPHWACYCELLSVMVLSTSFEFTANSIEDLRSLIERYLPHFKQLYPNTMTPKMHYLLHLPDQVIRFGPLRHHWCFRLEGKNALVKRFVGKNFKNLPKTVAERHQLYMCLHLLTPPGVESNNYLYSGDEINGVKECLLSSFHPTQLENTMRVSFPSKDSLPVALSAKCNGQEFRQGGIVCVSKPSDTEFPVFGEILHVVVCKSVSLVLQMFSTLGFNHHYHSYDVRLKPDTFSVVLTDQLAFFQVLHKYTVCTSIFVTVRSCDHIELPT